MQTFKKYSYGIYFIVLYATLSAFDYISHHDFNWFENLIQSIFYMLGLMFFNWVFHDKDHKEKIKK